MRLAETNASAFFQAFVFSFAAPKGFFFTLNAEMVG
jgi:hypothetical protein